MVSVLFVLMAFVYFIAPKILGRGMNVAEKWFPKEPGLIQVSVNNSIQ